MTTAQRGRRGATSSALTILTFLVTTVASSLPAAAQRSATPADANDPRLQVLRTEGYVAPPQPVLDAVLAAAAEDVRLTSPDPSNRWFLRSTGDGFPTLERFAKPHYNLGAWQIDFAANRERRLTTRSDVGIEVYGVDGQLARRIAVPAGARVSNAQWSPDGSRIAYFAHFPTATHIYTADPATGRSTQLTRTPVLATHVTSFEWTRDGRYVFTVLVPENRGAEPPAAETPETPKVRMTSSDRNALRTYFDLLEDPREKALVHYYSTGQLARIEVASRRVQPIGAPTMIEGIDASPDGSYLRVTRLKPELSYIVPTGNAGSIEEIWDASGRLLTKLDESDLNESVQRGSGAGGGDDDNDAANDKRQLSWRTDGPGMVFLHLEPRARGGDAQPPSQRDTTARKDRVMYWLPPFDSTNTQVIYETTKRMNSVRFDESGRLLFITRRDGDKETVHAVSLDDASRTEYLISEDDVENRRDDPGSLLMDDGHVRLSSDGRAVFLEGTRYFENPLQNAPRPFVDRVEISTGQKQRIFESAADVYETFNTALDDDLNQFIITRESPTTPPNQWLVNRQSNERRQLTHNADRHPRITAARREHFTVTRPDGFKSRVTVTLPPDYQPGTRVPAMFWFYPREYTEQEQYDEGFETFNRNDFRNVGARSMDILTLLGYAVVEPDVPIVGPDTNRRNDEYPHDLRNTLAAVIDTITERGWVDRSRLGIGGHSYGAFSTANAMIQTPFFKAGIAGDGNYNRSLTPAGFQSERRWLWEAQDLYIEMSPFFQADRLTGALLMYHGEDDHNVGTHPIHGDRMYHALEVLGKTAALYKYPFEDHGPATRETLLDLWARWVAWLDLYVKNPGTRPVTTTQAPTSGS